MSSQLQGLASDGVGYLKVQYLFFYLDKIDIFKGCKKGDDESAYKKTENYLFSAET